MKVLIAEDSVTYRKIWKDVCDSLTPPEGERRRISSIDYCASEDEASEKLRTKKYDLMIIDAELPGRDIMDFLDRVLRLGRVAGIMFTARPSRTLALLCERAVAMGADKFVIKPVNESYAFNRSILANELRTRLYPEKDDEVIRRRRESPARRDFKADVAVAAASTGGPPALEKLLSQMTVKPDCPLIIVQHIPSNYDASRLAAQLREQTDMEVRVPEDGEKLKSGTVYIAPSGRHMTVSAAYRVILTSSPPIKGLRPSADALFGSVADAYQNKNVLAVVLTGMGSDGAAGVETMKARARCICLTQSEDTCVVYGMPRAVAEMGLSDISADIAGIAGLIGEFTGGGERR